MIKRSSENTKLVKNLGFVVIVDGSNFVNDLRLYGKDINYLLNTLSFPLLQDVIQKILREQGLSSHPFVHTYFVVSNRSRLGHLNGMDREKFLEKLSNDLGVTVDVIPQTHGKGKEEQVDMHVFIRMLQMGPLSVPQRDPWRHIVLLSSDSDFVPAIRLLSMMGTHTIVAGFKKLGNKEFPKELVNESYLFIEMSEIISEMERRQSCPSNLEKRFSNKN